MSWWTAHASRVISEDIPAPPDRVRDFYVDLNNITEFHPLVVSVNVLTHERAADGHQTTYRVRDRISFGPLTIGISYRARIRVPARGDVITAARQFPRIRLDGTVSFEPVGQGTRLTERLTIAASRPLAATTQRKAVDAHRAMLAGIRRYFETN